MAGASAPALCFKSRPSAASPLPGRAQEGHLEGPILLRWVGPFLYPLLSFLLTVHRHIDSHPLCLSRHGCMMIII